MKYTDVDVNVGMRQRYINGFRDMISEAHKIRDDVRDGRPIDKQKTHEVLLNLHYLFLETRNKGYENTILELEGEGYELMQTATFLSAIKDQVGYETTFRFYDSKSRSIKGFSFEDVVSEAREYIENVKPKLINENSNILQLLRFFNYCQLEKDHLVPEDKQMTPDKVVEIGKFVIERFIKKDELDTLLLYKDKVLTCFKNLRVAYKDNLQIWEKIKRAENEMELKIEEALKRETIDQVLDRVSTESRTDGLINISLLEANLGYSSNLGREIESLSELYEREGLDFNINHALDLVSKNRKRENSYESEKPKSESRENRYTLSQIMDILYPNGPVGELKPSSKLEVVNEISKGNITGRGLFLLKRMSENGQIKPTHYLTALECAQFAHQNRVNKEESGLKQRIDEMFPETNFNFNPPNTKQNTLILKYNSEKNQPEPQTE